MNRWFELLRVLQRICRRILLKPSTLKLTQFFMSHMKGLQLNFLGQRNSIRHTPRSISKHQRHHKRSQHSLIHPLNLETFGWSKVAVQLNFSEALVTLHRLPNKSFFHQEHKLSSLCPSETTQVGVRWSIDSLPTQNIACYWAKKAYIIVWVAFVGRIESIRWWEFWRLSVCTTPSSWRTYTPLE